MIRNKSRWLLISVVFAVAILAILGRNYWLQAEEQRQLEDSLFLAKQKLVAAQNDSLHYQKENLEKQLNQLESELKVSTAGLFSPKDGIAISDTIINIASTCNVKITEFTSSNMTRESVAGLSVSSQPVQMKIEGELNGLVSFTLELSKRFPLSVVENLKMDTGANGDMAKADISVAVYTDIY